MIRMGWPPRATVPKLCCKKGRSVDNGYNGDRDQVDGMLLCDNIWRPKSMTYPPCTNSTIPGICAQGVRHWAVYYWFMHLTVA